MPVGLLPDCPSVDICSCHLGMHPIATCAAPVGLSPNCHSVDIWSRCSGAHPIATHTCLQVRLSPNCHSVYILGFGNHKSNAFLVCIWMPSLNQEPEIECIPGLH